jgi:hypothetical protein
MTGRANLNRLNAMMKRHAIMILSLRVIQTAITHLLVSIAVADASSMAMKMECVMRMKWEVALII